MKVMVLGKATERSEAGEFGTAEEFAAMDQFNEKLVEAGVEHPQLAVRLFNHPIETLGRRPLGGADDRRRSPGRTGRPAPPRSGPRGPW